MVRVWRYLGQTFTFSKRPNPKAQGGDVEWEACACGAVRVSLRNGTHREIGEWRP